MCLVDLAWMPSAHQPFTAGQGRENKMEDSSKVEIREFTKEKVKVCVCTSEEGKKKKSFSTSHQQYL